MIKKLGQVSISEYEKTTHRDWCRVFSYIFIDNQYNCIYGHDDGEKQIINKIKKKRFLRCIYESFGNYYKMINLE